MWLYAVKLQKILLIEEFSLYYSDRKPAIFTLNFFKKRIDKNIELNLWFQNGKGSMTHKPFVIHFGGKLWEILLIDNGAKELYIH